MWNKGCTAKTSSSTFDLQKNFCKVLFDRIIGSDEKRKSKFSHKLEIFWRVEAPLVKNTACMYMC